MGETWLDYTNHLLANENGETLDEKIINRTVMKVKHYLGKSLL